MNPEIKQKWIEALRSGAYKQGIRALRSVSLREGVKHCCLGVLCDLIDSSKWRGQIYVGGDEERMSYVPDDIARRIGLTDEAQHALVRMNDNGYSFGEIADYIEGKL